MWDFYDRLIDLVPKDLTVDRITVGDTWCFVAAGDLRGIAVTVNEQERLLPSFSKYRGVSLKEVAALCKSWNFVEASVGTAALNAYLNTKDRLKEVGAEETTGGFHDYKKIAAGKKVAIIGHFFQLERFLTQSSVYVLERSPEPGDYPDPACEYLLPEMDYTFITGSSFINKTLPRLLQLCRHPIILGPSTPMCDLIFSYGAKELSGLSLHKTSPEDELFAARGGVRTSALGTRYRLVP